MHKIIKAGRLFCSIHSGWVTGLWKLVFVLLLAGAGTARGTPNDFGPYVITRTLTPSYSYGALRGLTFTGGSLYALDQSGYIHQLNPLTGQSLMNWYVPGLNIQYADDNPTGLAWDGNSFWMATYGTQYRNYIRGLTLGSSTNATVTITYQLPTTSVIWPMDLTYVNGQLMFPQYSDSIREFNQGTGQLTGSLPSPSGLVYGLTYDGQNLLAGYGLGGTIWRISTQTGAVLDTWETGVPNIISLAYDQLSQTLFIGTGSSIVVAQAPEPGTLAIGVLGLMALGLAKVSPKRRKH
jgi:hypothetical protein